MHGIVPRVGTSWRLLGDPGERHPSPALAGRALRRPWQTAHGSAHAPATPLHDRLAARTRVGPAIHSAKERPMSDRSDPIEWTPEVVLSLRQLWDEGHSTAEIGRRLGVSKNAVVGKAHRLDLPSRPSPIRTEGGSTPRPPRRPPVPRLADFVPLATAGVVPARLLSETCRFSQRTTPARANPMAQDRATFAPSSPGAIGNDPCCWPIGEPGKGGFRFCDSLALIGKPYCGEHAQLAYRRVRRRDDDDRMAASR